jgi:hypothetical protein
LGGKPAFDGRCLQLPLCFRRRAQLLQRQRLPTHLPQAARTRVRQTGICAVTRASSVGGCHSSEQRGRLSLERAAWEAVTRASSVGGCHSSAQRGRWRHLKRRPLARALNSASSDCRWCSFHCRYTSAFSSSLCTAPGTASQVKNTGRRRMSASTACLTTEPDAGAAMRMASPRAHTRRGLCALATEKGMSADAAMMSPLSSASSS